MSPTRNREVQYYLHDGPAAFRLHLLGIIDDGGARRLQQVWHTASSLIGNRRRIVDITFVTEAGEQGRALLADWHRAGVEFVAGSKASRTLAESILGTGPLEPASKARGRLPFRPAFFKSATVPWLLAALLFTFTANAANLKSETVAAWDDYLETTKASLEQRARPGGSFLWTFESPERAAGVRAGEIVVAPAAGPTPRKVPGGLIHHWMGAMFLPDLTIGQVLQVTRNYDRYKDYYQPSVIESKTVARNDANDRFFMRMMNKRFLLKNVLDADYQTTNVRLDEHRFYSFSQTTRVWEIEEYGEPGEHRLPEGEGDGYIWKLFSIARFEQRDGGVYAELEAIALSREIPVAARLLVDPIVRRVSRNSMLVSLRQTQDAVRGDADLTARLPAFR